MVLLPVHSESNRQRGLLLQLICLIHADIRVVLLNLLERLALLVLLELLVLLILDERWLIERVAALLVGDMLVVLDRLIVEGCRLLSHVEAIRVELVLLN